MNNFRSQIENIFKASAKSFHRFPASIFSAIVISIVGIVRIRMGWEVQKTYDFLFTSIQMAFFLGAVFSMAAIAWEEIRSDKNKSFFILVNLAGILFAGMSFLLLYFYGGKIAEDQTVYLSSIAMARASAAIFISIVAFLYIMSKSKSIDSFSDSFFISHKAFIISAIYGIVMMIGVSGVLGAFQSLVYRDMDNRIFQYVGVAIGFITYTIFLGYFPDFREKEDEGEIARIVEEPRFIFVLFEYILIPIIMALTVVLLIWSLRVVLNGLDVSFNQLSSIASSYVIIGIWLHIMVSRHETKLSNFYKRAYPFAGILILAFEAWALYVQLNKFGLKTAEYSFFMIWVFAVISVLLLMILKDRAYRKIALTAVVISAIWVLPIIGYEDITFNSQVKRLEKILINQELLINDEIIPSSEEIEFVKRGEITDAVDFISYSEKENIPGWFKKDYNNEEVFKNTFGFEKTYGVYPEPSEYYSTNFRLKTDVIDINDYSLSLTVLQNEKANIVNRFEGEDGIYEVTITNENFGVPKIVVKLNDSTIIERDMEKYLSNLLIKYPSRENRGIQLPLEEMSFIVEREDISILLVFNSIDAYFDQKEDKANYYIDFGGIYVKYK